MSIIFPQSVDMTATECDDDFWRTATPAAQHVAQMTSGLPPAANGEHGAWTACGDYLWLDGSLPREPQAKP